MLPGRCRSAGPSEAGERHRPAWAAALLPLFRVKGSGRQKDFIGKFDRSVRMRRLLPFDTDGNLSGGEFSNASRDAATVRHHPLCMAWPSAKAILAQLSQAKRANRRCISARVEKRSRFSQTALGSPSCLSHPQQLHTKNSSGHEELIEVICSKAHSTYTQSHLSALPAYSLYVHRRPVSLSLGREAEQARSSLAELVRLQSGSRGWLSR